LSRRRPPRVTAVIVATLALDIRANTAIFSAIAGGARAASIALVNLRRRHPV
jgi:hypothetical protein